MAIYSLAWSTIQAVIHGSLNSCILGARHGQCHEFIMCLLVTITVNIFVGNSLLSLVHMGRPQGHGKHRPSNFK